MARVLITGMSGVGKSSLLSELRCRGHRTVNTHCSGCEPPDGTWDETQTDRLFTTPRDVVVAGTVENQGRFDGRFEHVILLSAPLSGLLSGPALYKAKLAGRARVIAARPDDQAQIPAA